MKKKRWMTVEEFEERFDGTNSLYLAIEMSLRLRECDEIIWGIFAEKYTLCYQYSHGDCEKCPLAMMGEKCGDKGSLWKTMLKRDGRGVVVAEELLRYMLQALPYLEPEKGEEFLVEPGEIKINRIGQ